MRQDHARTPDKRVIQRSGITVKEVVPNALVAPLAVANSDEMHDGVATVDLAAA